MIGAANLRAKLTAVGIQGRSTSPRLRQLHSAIRPAGKTTTQRPALKASIASRKVSRVFSRERSSGRHSTGITSVARPGQTLSASRLAK